MTKQEFTKAMETIKAVRNEDMKAWTMSQAKFDKMVESEVLGDAHIMKSPQQPGYYRITSANKKTVFGYIQIVSKASTKTENKNGKMETKVKNIPNNAGDAKKAAKKEIGLKPSKAKGGQGHKVRNDGYIIKFKKKDDKKETVKTDISTCAEIKAWIKTISKKQMEYLHIYDTANNECRKSAWIG